MTRIFVELPLFRSKWKALGLTDDDLKRLQEEILLDPKTGAVIKETGGIRKMRFAFEHRGKSGSIRVIYIDFEVYEKIYLLTAYPKNEKDNLTKAERNELRGLVEILERQLAESEKEE
ncbi:MAG: type II toxin-antitoxin system RelE/ParE family toxin [Clostridia bacterium]|nr:type II toxin-antitoxin system RelE/ParE family toxin [Clostridia bacterium]